MYRLGVGTLLYLVKHSQLDIANTTRELLKLMSMALEANWKKLLRVIRFVLKSKTVGLKVEPKLEEGHEQWKMKIYTDANWAGGKETRVSVSGFVLFFCSVAIMWRSQGQKSVALSSRKSEYILLSEAAKEVKFVAMLLKSMRVKVKQPIEV